MCRDLADTWESRVVSAACVLMSPLQCLRMPIAQVTWLQREQAE